MSTGRESTCSNCLARHADKSCRLNPPAPSIMVARNLAGEPVPQVVAAWPPVPDAGYCLQWVEGDTKQPMLEL